MPVLWTTAWAVKLGIDKSTNPESKCWYAYSSENSYYIVEGPRLALIAVSKYVAFNLYTSDCSTFEVVGHERCIKDIIVKDTS